MCISLSVSGRNYFLRAIHISGFYSLSASTLLYKSLNLEGRNLMKTSHLGPSSPSLLLYAYCPVVSLCFNSHLQQGKAFLMMVEYSLVYDYSNISLWVILLLCFFNSRFPPRSITYSVSGS